MGFFGNIIDSIKNSTRSRFRLDKEINTIELLLNTKDENYFTLQFTTMELNNLYDTSVLNAYQIKGINESLGTLYIETIQLKPLHDWNCSGGSAFDMFIKEQFQKEQLQFIDSADSEFAKFSKYQIDYQNEIGLLWFNLNNIDVFIIDTRGKLFNDVLKIYHIKNKDLYIKDTSNEVSLQLKSSLTATNLRENYFAKKD